MVDEQRVDGRREREGGEAHSLEERDAELLARDVERTENGHRRSRPERMRAGRLDERRDEEHARARRQRAEQIRPAAPGRRTERDDEERRGDHRDRDGVRCEQRGDRERGEQSGCGRRAHPRPS